MSLCAVFMSNVCLYTDCFSLKRPRKRLVDAPQWLLPRLTPFSCGHMTARGCCGFNADEADNEDYRPIWKITFTLSALSALPSQVFCVQQWDRLCGGNCLMQSSFCSFSQLVRVCPQERQWALEELGVAGETSAGRIRTHSTPSPLTRLSPNFLSEFLASKHWFETDSDESAGERKAVQGFRGKYVETPRRVEIPTNISWFEVLSVLIATNATLWWNLASLSSFPPGAATCWLST